MFDSSFTCSLGKGKTLLQSTTKLGLETFFEPTVRTYVRTYDNSTNSHKLSGQQLSHGFFHAFGS